MTLLWLFIIPSRFMCSDGFMMVLATGENILSQVFVYSVKVTLPHYMLKKVDIYDYKKVHKSRLICPLKFMDKECAVAELFGSLTDSSFKKVRLVSYFLKDSDVYMKPS